MDLPVLNEMPRRESTGLTGKNGGWISDIAEAPPPRQGIWLFEKGGMNADPAMFRGRWREGSRNAAEPHGMGKRDQAERDRCRTLSERHVKRDKCRYNTELEKA